MRKKRLNSEKIFKIIVWILFVFYFIICLKVMLFKYASFQDILHGNISRIRSINLIPLRTVRDFFKIANEQGAYLWAFSNIFGNILITVPMGYCMMLLFPKVDTVKKAVLITFTYSLIIESSQYLFHMGAADIDDILCNIIGGLFGCVVYILIKKFLKEKQIIYAITIIGAIIVFVSGFAVAKEQFGGLLGIVTYETEYKGKENIPDRSSDFNGTLYNIVDKQLYAYEGLITGKNDPAASYANKNVFTVNENTSYFLLNYEKDGYTTIINYKPIRYDEINLSDGFIRMQLWLDENNNVSHAVIDKRFTDLVNSGQINSNAKTETTIPSEKPLHENNPDRITDIPSVTTTPSQVPDIISEEDTNIKEEPKEEILQGYIRKLYEDSFEFEIVTVESIEGLGDVSSSTGVNATAYFTEDTSYMVQVIKNGGFDVTKKEGSQNDLVEGYRVKMTGYHDNDNFIAKEIIISIFK